MGEVISKERIRKGGTRGKKSGVEISVTGISEIYMGEKSGI